MTPTHIVDLVVLGTVRSGPKRFSDVCSTARNLFPDIWYPTTGVIESAILRGLENQSLNMQDAPATPESFRLTAIGKQQLEDLLTLDQKDAPSTTGWLIESLQLHFLDFATPDVAAQVLSRLRQQSAARVYVQERCHKRISRGGRFANVWMAMENRRANSSLDSIHTALNVNGAGKISLISGALGNREAAE